MKKDDVISVLMDFQNQLLVGIASSGLIDRDKLFRVIMVSVAAISDSPNNEFDV